MDTTVRRPASRIFVKMRPATPYPYVLHAEANAITKIARSGNSSEGATLYVTTSPCIECSKLIIQAGRRNPGCISEHYRLSDGNRLAQRGRYQGRLQSR